MKMLRVGSTVKVQGIILEINQSSANMNINNHTLAYTLTDLEEEDLFCL